VSFNSLTFPLFFVLVYIAYLAARRSFRTQNFILVVASYIFYGAWDWRFLGLLGGSTAANYGIGLLLQGEDRQTRRRAIVSGGVGLNLLLIGIFKYFNFFASNLIALADPCGRHIGYSAVNIVLPVGISFYTFQAISYIVDVYRRDIEATRNVVDFALFKSFFPQLVAGPIERAKHFLPQIVRRRVIVFDDLAAGSWFVLYGYFLKVFVADNLGPIADRAFAAHTSQTGGEALLGVYAFAFQIFGDFAGYTGIAIGVARLMGFHLTTNFLYPYFVTNPRAFWRNWHISLSKWLRDYVYISLGGSRGTQMQTYRNLMLTMLLGGLWHGAAWTFVLWGAYQGALLVAHRMAEPHLRRFHVPSMLAPMWWAARLLFMFQLTCFGWLIFRARSLKQVTDMIQSIATNFTFPSAATYEALEILFYVLPLIAINALQMRSADNNWGVLRLKTPARLAVVTGLYWLIAVWGQFGARQFIYFQF
jgi:alginate O-acetyltransferase complex protein AlgI